nr:hypothetical protein [Tanacetum cinerariifolium]
MTSLGDKAILSGVDNHPSMLEKDMYDSWKSRMELYMLNRQHGWMILESVESGPLLWPTIEENRVTRLNKYSELSTTEAIQADCNVKATNIILQGLPLEVYALVSTHKVSKELLERIQMLMQGMSLTKQERECKLYDEFDKFVYRRGESLRDYYLIFSLLLNDMNIYNMKFEQFQVNTKFLNTLPPEWSKFVTDMIPLKGPLIWPSIEENGVTKPKEYFELSAMETIQADCDVKATNIILQGLAPETRVQTKDHNDSLIAQINSKTIENADLKAQIQEKVFANVDNVDTKFAKPSILGKPALKPPRNQSVVRQPNAFKSKRPIF